MKSKNNIWLWHKLVVSNFIPFPPWLCLNSSQWSFVTRQQHPESLRSAQNVTWSLNHPWKSLSFKPWENFWRPLPKERSEVYHRVHGLALCCFSLCGLEMTGWFQQGPWKRKLIWDLRGVWPLRGWKVTVIQRREVRPSQIHYTNSTTMHLYYFTQQIEVKIWLNMNANWPDLLFLNPTERMKLWEDTLLSAVKEDLLRALQRTKEDLLHPSPQTPLRYWQKSQPMPGGSRKSWPTRFNYCFSVDHLLGPRSLVRYYGR